jgi:hypothetical protein
MNPELEHAKHEEQRLQDRARRQVRWGWVKRWLYQLTLRWTAGILLVSLGLLLCSVFVVIWFKEEVEDFFGAPLGLVFVIGMFGLMVLGNFLLGVVFSRKPETISPIADRSQMNDMEATWAKEDVDDDQRWAARAESPETFPGGALSLKTQTPESRLSLSRAEHEAGHLSEPEDETDE